MINQTFPTLNVKETGTRIKSLRVSNGYSVEEVAGYMGFTGPQAVYKWEWGRSLPTVDNLFALSRLYGVAIEEILVGNDEFFHYIGKFFEPPYVIKCSAIKLQVYMKVIIDMIYLS